MDEEAVLVVAYEILVEEVVLVVAIGGRFGGARGDIGCGWFGGKVRCFSFGEN